MQGVAQKYLTGQEEHSPILSTVGVIEAKLSLNLCSSAENVPILYFISRNDAQGNT